MQFGFPFWQSTDIAKSACSRFAIGFRIAVVQGNTPFLISSAFLRGIKAVIDTDRETLRSKLLEKNLTITRTPKNLFLLDITQLWEEPSRQSKQKTAFIGTIPPEIHVAEKNNAAKESCPGETVPQDDKSQSGSGMSQHSTPQPSCAAAAIDPR